MKSNIKIKINLIKKIKAKFTEIFTHTDKFEKFQSPVM